MRNLRTTLLLSLVIGLSAAASAFGQKSTFSDPNVDYSFDLPDPKWKMTVKPSTTSPNVEYVFVDRNDGHLEVRKLTVAKTAAMADIVRQEELKLQFNPGYVAGKEENFRGSLTGTAFNYEFTRSGRPMTGRFYFLKADETTVYVLRFTGFSDKLKSVRNQTDAIARTFSVKRS
ncbi:MAG TPA: hypothetical protein VGQ55_16485 [Pyrinomonadaceae bacterium]|nr:hypothetical protein [Pyrinomonadaceae bacterium]